MYIYTYMKNPNGRRLSSGSKMIQHSIIWYVIQCKLIRHNDIMYIYIEREREGERDIRMYMRICVHICAHIYIYIYTHIYIYIYILV